MPIDTNLNVSPYYDDFNEEKNFHRVLFRPSVAVQARELTQLQTILQNQIERFGDNIYTVGTIIKGCSLTTDYFYYYIKIRDNQVDGQQVNLSGYANTLLIQTSSNLQAYVVNSKTGLESQNPDLNTLYIKYLNTGTSGEKVYSNGQVITVYDRSRTIESIEVTNGGTLYSNSDTVVISGGGGAGAVATLTTFANGTISSITISNKGSGYTSNPSVSITTSTGSSAVLTPRIFIAQVTVANSSFTAPVGIGTAIKTSEGVIYQKGNFIRVDAQEEILSKYTTSPSNVAVGFVVSESFVNSSVDTTLLDNATGSTNFAAPGADRLKLDPILTVINRELASANTDFLSLLEYQDGNVVKDRTFTQFNSVNDALSRRTFEESGDYVVSQFPLNTAAKEGNTTHFDLVVGAGLAYVGGSRIELLNTIKVPVRKGSNLVSSPIQSIASVYGNYVVVNQLMGAFDVKTGATVTLRSAAGTDVTDNAGGTPTLPGIQIGTAKVRSIDYDGGVAGTPDCRYKLYLFDIRMSKGFSFKDVRSIASAGVALADVVLQNNEALLEDVRNDKLVFNSGTFAVKEFNNEQFIFRTSSNSTIQTTGNASFSFSGGNTLPYGSVVLSSSIKQQFIVVPATTLVSNVNKSGTVSVANSTTLNVSGTSTAFTTEYQVGDYIKIGTLGPVRITTIFNDSTLAVSSNVGSVTANVHTFAYPANVPIDFTKKNKVIEVTSPTSLTLSLGHGLTGTGTMTLYHDMQNFEPSVKTKTVNNPVYVKISKNAIAKNQNGPWCLGIPDVFEITGVFVGSNTTYSNTSTTNYKNSFILENGQKDNVYGLSYIKRRPGTSLSLGTNSNLLVEVKAFTHSAGKYISTESYPVDDVTTPIDDTSYIRTQEIPYYVSPTTGEGVSLRDALDFRPIVANTANLSSTAASATIDPDTTENLVAGEKFFPSPTKSFEASIQSYLSRADRIVMESDGNIRVIEGVPSSVPVPAPKVKGAMDLGIIRVAPFPSLSAKEAFDAKRPDLANDIRLSQTKRYTMYDIGSLEERIRTLEYYTSLNQLESNTKNLTVVSEANNQVERFKNGFLVDPFNNYDLSNLDDPEYRALIDPKSSRLYPLKQVTDVKLKYGSGGQRTNDLVTLPYTSEILIDQQYANKERTLVEENWSFKGQMQVVPNFDNFFDTEITATSAISVDLASPIESLVRSINDALVGTTLSSQLVDSGVEFGEDRNAAWNVIDRDIISVNEFTDTRFGGITVPTATTKDLEVGSFLTNITLNPYIRPQKIAVFVSGLRPGARHYVFFDGVDVNSSCTPAQISQYTNVGVDDFVATGQKGDNLVASNTGELSFFLNIPSNTFNTGERDILVMDVSSVASELSATSKSVGRFSSFSFTGDKTRVTFSTRSFEISAQNQFQSSTFTRSRTERFVVGRDFQWWDPLAQTFRVISQVQGSDTVFLTSVDLFFKQKDPQFGVSVEIREVGDTGYPTELVLPFSKVYKTSSDVNVSSTASNATTFTFESPVAVKAGREYAIVITPDANSPEYRIWTGQTGLPDVTNPLKIMNESWGLGTLFYSVSGSAFTAVQNEDIKFKVNYAKFSSLSDSITLTNAEQEFLSVNNSIGTFIGGEDVGQLSTSYINATLTTNNESRQIATSSDLSSTLSTNDWIAIIYDGARTARANVSVVGTTVTNTTASSFDVDFSAGDFVKIGNSSVSEIRQVVQVSNATQIILDAAPFGSYTNHEIFSIDPGFDVIQIKAANSTVITGNKPTSITSNANTASKCSFQKVVRGFTTLYNGEKGILYLNGSNASNSTFQIKTSNSSYLATVVGSDSNARASVTSVDNVNISSFTPLINSLVLKGTSISLAGTFNKVGGGTINQSFSLTRGGFFDSNTEIQIKSLSNEITGSTINKSLSLVLGLSSSTSDMSPVVDLSSSLITSSYSISSEASTSNEHTNFGTANAKYISKRLVLSEGLEAEDVKVYLTAYRPANTEIKVYAKIINEADNEPFDNKAWSELQLVTPATVSSSYNENDLRELEYTFKNSPTSYVLQGAVATSSNSSVIGSGVNFIASFNANSNVNESTDFIGISDCKFNDDDLITYVVESSNTPLTALNQTFGNEVSTSTVNASGTGYTNGDIVTLTTGTGDPASFVITTGGANTSVASVNLVSRGLYSANPTLSGSATQAVKGSGSGLTIDVTMRSLHGPFFAVGANTSGTKLSLTSNGTVIQLTKGATESGHFLSVLNSQDLVKVVRTDSDLDYEIFPVSAVVNSTAIVVSGNVSFTTSGATLEKVTIPGEAFKYKQSPYANGAVRYFDSKLTPYDTYKVLALKIVLLSDFNNRVPSVNDVRAVAVSV